VKLLLDTHLTFWLALEPDQLRAAEAAILAAPETDIAASVVSLWELRVKWSRRYVSGERKGPAHPSDVLAWLNRNAVPIVDLSAAVTVASLEPPLDHGDPFDELLLMQAQHSGYRLFTRDAKLALHPAALIAA
jgi:PIN domain nuclease of toxin-antitoxin system